MIIPPDWQITFNLWKVAPRRVHVWLSAELEPTYGTGGQACWTHIRKPGT